MVKRTVGGRQSPTSAYTRQTQGIRWHTPASMVRMDCPEATVNVVVVPAVRSVTFDSSAVTGVKRKSAGFPNKMVYGPGGTLENRYFPASSVVAVANGVVLVPCRSSTLMPATPGSPASWMPLAFWSCHTRSPTLEPDPLTVGVSHFVKDGSIPLNAGLRVKGKDFFRH